VAGTVAAGLFIVRGSRACGTVATENPDKKSILCPLHEILICYTTSMAVTKKIIQPLTFFENLRWAEVRLSDMVSL
jgi:hypothetical protein